MLLFQKRNRIATHLKKNFIALSSITAGYGLPLTNDHRKIFRLKNKHKNQIGFLIGNGPSVRLNDLDRLKDKTTFCCNRFHLAYDKLTFRPKYTLTADLQVIEDFGQEIVWKSENLIFIIWKYPVNLKGEYIWVRAEFGHGFSEDVFKCVYPGGGTLIAGVQIGYFLGIKKFFLYGIDHNFKFRTCANSVDEWRIAQGNGNHFIKNYRSGKQWAPPPIDKIEKSFKLCDNFLRSEGGWLKNATRGGKLEVLERVDFDKIDIN